MRTWSLYLFVVVITGCGVKKADFDALQTALASAKQQNEEFDKKIRESDAAFEQLTELRWKLETTYKDEVQSLEKQLASSQAALEQANHIAFNWRSNYLKLQSTSADYRKAQWVQALAYYQKGQAERESLRREEERAEEQCRAQLLQQRAEIATKIHESESERIKGLR